MKIQLDRRSMEPENSVNKQSKVYWTLPQNTKPVQNSFIYIAISHKTKQGLFSHSACKVGWNFPQTWRDIFLDQCCLNVFNFNFRFVFQAWRVILIDKLKRIARDISGKCQAYWFLAMDGLLDGKLHSNRCCHCFWCEINLIYPAFAYSIQQLLLVSYELNY